MTRKANRLAGAQLSDFAQRGEWAELYFMMMAAGLGMNVSRPFGALGKYDVGVENRGNVLRVQVKSTSYKRSEQYCSLREVAEIKKYAPGTIDFFAILLIPIDDWYIVPFDVMTRKESVAHFTPRQKRMKYGRYREAWSLLQGHTEIKASGSGVICEQDHESVPALTRVVVVSAEAGSSTS